MALDLTAPKLCGGIGYFGWVLSGQASRLLFSFMLQKEEQALPGGMDKDGTTENNGDHNAGELICTNISNVQADHNGNPWSTGLFDCHEHKMNALMTVCFPYVTFGQISEVLDAGEMTCPLGSYIYLLMMSALCTQWLMGSKYSSKLRRKYNLVEAPYSDVISHIFCPYCALCQEFRELKNRGLDPSLGWNRILAEQRGTQYTDQQMKSPPYQAMKK